MNQLPRKTPKAIARSQVQRARILDAAAKSFTAEGIHAASMATVAKTAGMSVGLIYRYFESKSDIVQALIEQEVEETRIAFHEIGSSGELLDGILDAFAPWRRARAAGDTVNVALAHEIIAEATRVPAIAEAMQRADEAYREIFSEWIHDRALDQGIELSPAQVRQRALLLHIMIDGLFARAILEAGLKRTTLKSALRGLMQSLFTA
ncbi:TetR/AcrR family transcriptional regulator [Dyella tabacisoli]|nr:TetR/AcrR family transcriptional regulator [Dyella tabacisoli]